MSQSITKIYRILEMATNSFNFFKIFASSKYSKFILKNGLLLNNTNQFNPMIIDLINTSDMIIYNNRSFIWKKQ